MPGRYESGREKTAGVLCGPAEHSDHTAGLTPLKGEVKESFQVSPGPSQVAIEWNSYTLKSEPALALPLCSRLLIEEGRKRSCF